MKRKFITTIAALLFIRVMPLQVFAESKITANVTPIETRYIEGYKVVVYDQPDYSYRDLADSLVEFLNDFGSIKTYTSLGHAFTTDFVTSKTGELAAYVNKQLKYGYNISMEWHNEKSQKAEFWNILRLNDGSYFIILISI